MNAKPTIERFRYSRLVAPVVLILFAVGWYRFSVVYIQGADDQLVAKNNLAVYVPIQQIQSYLTVLLDATILVVAIGLAILVYNILKFARFRARRARGITPST